ncbi:MAG: hypothetical protein KDK27_05220, partial [Leptospiraceae bacterium]|nr:hypothetical protein [Leptospiraceae bacterium]
MNYNVIQSFLLFKSYRRSTLIGALLLLIVVSGSCMEIAVTPIFLPLETAEPDAPAPVVRIVITGEDAHRSDWARASTISRFFAGRVDNSTGSLAQLIEPTLREILFRRGYRVARSPMEVGTTGSDSQAASGETDTAANDASDAASAHADYILEVKFLRNILAWIPPQTFIQTPGRYHVGNVRLGFYIE